MAFVRTAFIVLALLLGWTAVRHQAHARTAPVAASVQREPSLVHWLVWRGGDGWQGLVPLVGGRRYSWGRA
jgi:hypothetical protein